MFALRLTGPNGLCGTSASFDACARIVAGRTAHVLHDAMLRAARAWHVEAGRCPTPTVWPCPAECRRCEWERAA